MDDIESRIAELSDEQARTLELAIRGELARKTNDLAGYKHFHWCVFGQEIPLHAEAWLTTYFKDWEKPSGKGMRGVLNKAARGLAKSTETLGFVLYQTGHYPHLSSLIIQATDDDAKKWAKFMADTIESNVGWKACFPNVVPDKDRGWSLDGYNIKDTSVDYGEWINKVSADHKRDPSFVATSVVSGSVGMHPTAFLVIDDVHTEKNTSSETEMLAIKSKIKADIVPTMNRPGRKPCMLVAYTPWRKNDTYSLFEETGIFTSMVTPAFVYDENGDKEFEEKKIRLTWPAVYSLNVLKQNMRLLGRREFARQVLCDLEQAKTRSLPFYSFSHDALSADWYMVGGADPTSVVKHAHEDVKKRSFFALAYVVRLPQGGAVVMDGVLEQCSQLEAENFIKMAQTRFPRYAKTMVENQGVGSSFIQTCRRDPTLRIVDSNLQGFRGGAVKSKEDRIEKEMMPWFENGTVRISDKDSKFLNALRKGFDQFFELDKHDSAWDALDSVFHALKGMPEVLKLEVTEDGSLPSVNRRERVSIFAGLRDHKG